MNKHVGSKFDGCTNEKCIEEKEMLHGHIDKLEEPKLVELLTLILEELKGIKDQMDWEWEHR